MFATDVEAWCKSQQIRKISFTIEIVEKPPPLRSEDIMQRNFLLPCPRKPRAVKDDLQIKKEGGGESSYALEEEKRYFCINS